MKLSMKVDGWRDIERALADLPRSTAKSVTRRVLKKVLDPVRDAADAYTGEFAIAVGTRLSPRQRGMARGDFAGAVVSMYVGPTQEDGSHAPHAHLIEFGTGPRYWKSGKFTGHVTPKPFMRPAWDAMEPGMLDDLGRLMWVEIEKTVARRAARASKAA